MTTVSATALRFPVNDQLHLVTDPTPDDIALGATATAAAHLFRGILVGQFVDEGATLDGGIVATAEQARRENGTVTGGFLVEDAAVARVIPTEDGRLVALLTGL